jgi:hypothetical protein
MKTIKTISILFLSLITFLACNDEDLNVDNHDGKLVEGGLIRNDSQLVNYVVGSDGTYTFNALVYQGAVKTTSVDIMVKFTNKTSSTNEVLLTTIPVNFDTTNSISFSTTYEQLISGLLLDGQPMSSSDTELKIANFWTLTFVSHTNEGNAHINPIVSKLAVSTRLAGNYTVTRGWYIHPTTAPGLAGDYSGAYTRIIESVDLISEYAVYKSTSMGWGPAGGWFDPNCNFFYFYVMNAASPDGSFEIVIPKEYNGVAQTLWCSDELANCIDNPNNIPDVSCNTRAVLSTDGHDVLHLSYGYIRSSGTRQFDEILTKQ